ncbi:globin [Paenibacillus sp. UNC499MF]|nr:globin [Paenibacillus sp. UNC499MF]
METSLYDKLGGKDVIGKVVEDFYKRVMEDESVNHFFRDTDMAKQLLIRRPSSAMRSAGLPTRADRWPRPIRDLICSGSISTALSITCRPHCGISELRRKISVKSRIKWDP